MQCVACGTELPEGALLCPQCGRVVSTEDKIRQQAADKPMTKKEFYQLPGVKSCRNNIIACAIVLYICGAATFLMSLEWVNTTGTVMASMIDAVLLLAFGLWLQLGKSRVCAILISAYGIFNVVYVLATVGNVQGWLIPVAGIDAVIYTFRLQKLWKQHLKTGDVPDGAIKDF